MSGPSSGLLCGTLPLVLVCGKSEQPLELQGSMDDFS